MKEIRQIVEAFELMDTTRQKAALATVVQVEGSSYRRPGARMLIKDNGEVTGAISGGCLEGDVLRKALLVIMEQKPMLVTYDTTNDDDPLGIQLGCNGIVHILIEPIDATQTHHPIHLLKAAITQRQKAVLVTLFSVKQRRDIQSGTQFVMLESGKTFSNIHLRTVEDHIASHANTVLQNENTALTNCIVEKNSYSSLMQFIQPEVSLVIVGAGNDAIPLTQMAAILGWHITVIDGRRNHATQARFPLAHHVIIAKPDEALTKLSPDQQTVFVLMTHNYNYDLALLQQLIDEDIAYIGVLGPGKKLQRMLQEIQDAGITLNNQQQEKIFSPMGLDIGAETAEEIAVSIIAEIQAALSKRPGSSLRNKPTAIHARFANEVDQNERMERF